MTDDAPENNASSRLHDVFFYGLFMSAEVLAAAGVTPRNPRKASAPGYALRLGEKATLARGKGARAHGVVYALTHGEIDKLYKEAGLDDYFREAILVEIDGQGAVAALTVNRLSPPGPGESNPEYAEKLRWVMESLGFPIPF